MVKSSCLGMPRIGYDRELPIVLDKYFHKKASDADLFTVGKKIRNQNWKMQIEAGIDIIPCNDYSMFDHVLDTTVFVGNIPRRYYWEGGMVSNEIYFNMINGQQKEKFDVVPMQIGRWFNKNYLYIVPEFSDPVEFTYSDNKHILHYLEAKETLKINTRPTLMGPVSYLLIGRVVQEDIEDINPLLLLDDLLPVYDELFVNLRRLGITDIQFEEPFLVTDLTREKQSLYKDCYNRLREMAGNGLKIHLTTCYGDIGNNLECLMSLRTDSIHFDAEANLAQIDNIIEATPDNVSISLGVVSSENIWVNDLNKSIDVAERIKNKIGPDRLTISTSSSLFLCPVDLHKEKGIDPEAKKMLSFAKQKLHEVKLISDVLNYGKDKFKHELSENQEIISKINNIARSFASLNEQKLSQALSVSFCRSAPFAERIKIQNKEIYENKLPVLPVTLNGALPYESDLIDGSLNDSVKDAAQKCIAAQEKLDIDLLSDGEVDRLNNVEHFASKLKNIITTEYGFVQQYGHICVRPPILMGEAVAQKSGVYNDYASYVSSLTTKPVKINIVGSITFVNQSFLLPGVSTDCYYYMISSIIAEEIKKLEKIGIKIIQIDERSLMKNVSLREENKPESTRKVINFFNFMLSDVKNSTQIHTSIHNERFEDCIEDIARLDSDVALLDNSRSQDRIFGSLISYRYPNNIGIGVYDSFSDRIPIKPEIALTIKKTTRTFENDQIWITPDFHFKYKAKANFIKIMGIIVSVAKEMRKSIKS